MKKWVKIILGVFGGLLGLLLVAAGGYIAYMQANYYRIEDETLLETENTVRKRRTAAKLLPSLPTISVSALMSLIILSSWIPER